MADARLAGIIGRLRRSASRRARRAAAPRPARAAAAALSGAAPGVTRGAAPRGPDAGPRRGARDAPPAGAAAEAPAGLGRMAGRLRAPVLVAVGALLLALGVGAAMAWSSEQTVRIHALRLVESWSAAMTEAAPALPRHLRAGRLHEADLDPLRETGARADAYGFRLFDPQGAPVASAWRWRGRTLARLEPAPPVLRDAHGALPPEPGPLPLRSPGVWARLAAGERVVELDAAASMPGGPLRVAEVFLPVHDPAGEVAGYAEVYVDVAAFAARVERVQALAGVALAAAGALAFAGPAFAWLGARRRREQAEARVIRAASLDALTGLPNRAGFAEAAARAARAAARDGARLAVLAVDLDRFRVVNELHGPEMGDEVLRASAAQLRAGLRTEDLLSRVGPDDFAAVLRLADPGDLPAILARLSSHVATPRADAEGRPLTLSASIGACLLPPGETRVEAALRRAEIAQREARAAGPGRICVFAPEMEARVQRRREVETAIREGVAHGRFSLHYQPLVRSRDGTTRGFEALMRLRDAQGRPIPPAEFIPAAEDMDQIGALGAWALHEATSVAAGWPGRMAVSVNLSVAQFRDGRLVDTVRSALAASGLAPRRLELEVTESMLISDSEAVERQLAQLRALGVSIAMDDFGAGYSSLAYLWRFRFDRLKLDRSFVLAFDAHPARARGMIGGIVALGRRLGMKVTAEGIETPVQAAAMAELGCDTLQGYHFGRAMPEADLREVMRWEADADEERAVGPRPPLRDFAASHDPAEAPRPEEPDRRGRRPAEAPDDDPQPALKAARA
ncbi:putative bifunctional diguanylate cyclase/phosphodiesterase [Albimonas pacifica]|uniref:Diguanylate cyclase (GGDEF) domain-containing protein n=1 Tax=Albimonas pacifica TaxID=1114924 RepID=A0A1I3G864_9RHOB|nr:bifunctional diguanylate cyclase/phosphodiesterase [Albimonas pacifica]SFI19725.1 diguanylate cyclase (GGDEF) domain-containing protein [Albimonas pacifica]